MMVSNLKSKHMGGCRLFLYLPDHTSRVRAGRQAGLREERCFVVYAFRDSLSSTSMIRRKQEFKNKSHASAVRFTEAGAIFLALLLEEPQSG